MITLKTLHKATAQEVFDQCAKHLITQSVRSEDSNGYCAYRGKHSLSCAAGCFISDSEYSEEMESTSWTTLCGRDQVPDDHKELIGKLQDIHDHDSPQEWVEELKKLAKEEGLQLTLPKQIDR